MASFYPSSFFPPDYFTPGYFGGTDPGAPLFVQHRDFIGVKTSEISTDIVSRGWHSQDRHRKKQKWSVERGDFDPR